jgi:Leucine-rich repeat (LRR) protein
MEVPPSVWTMTSLEVLDLSANFLNGPLAPELGNLVHLRHLNLSGNFFSGPFPATATRLTKMETLDLSGNGFYPTQIPEFLCENIQEHDETSGFEGNPLDVVLSMPRLKHLALSGNMFNGTISPSLSSLSNLQILDIHDNLFHSEIPATLGNMASLIVLDLSDNFLNGTIPPSIGNLEQLTHLDLGSNFLVGTIPSEIGLLTNLEFLSISKTNGTLTASCLITSAPKIAPTDSISQYLPHQEMEYSTITIGEQQRRDRPHSSSHVLRVWHFFGINGTIPDSIGDLTKLRILDLSKNNLTGTIGHQILKLPVLERLLLNENTFFQPFPNITSLPSLIEVDLSSTTTYGSIFTSDPARVPQPNFSILRAANNPVKWLPELIYWSNLTEIDFHSNQRRATLEPEWSTAFTKLQRLDLSDNHLGGEIPERFFDSMSSLSHVNLSHNMLTGPLPPSLPQSVREFVAFSNRFNGSIPPNIIDQSLLYLDLHDNLIDGSIPPDLFRQSRETAPCLVWRFIHDVICPNKGIADTCNVLNRPLEHALCYPRLQHLDLSRNLLTGSIPTTLNLNANLGYLNLGFNDIDGTPLTLLANATYLAYLNLEVNNFQEELPSSLLASNRYLQVLDLSENGFYGDITNSFTTGIVRLSYLDLSVNDLRGNPMPSLCRALEGTLEVLDLHDNSLDGMIPPCAFPVEVLSYLDLSINSFTGSIPHSLISTPAIDTVNFGQNYFSGEIPSELYRLTTLRTLVLSDNDLTGSIDPQISRLKKLVHLELADNMLSGTIPDSVSELTELSDVLWGRNQLEGTLPAGFGARRPDCTFDVSSNSFSGQVPHSSYLNCSYVDLSTNQFTGTLPRELSPTIRYFDVSENGFQGPLPGIRDDYHTVISTLKFSDNHFTGTLPESFAKAITRTLYLDVSSNQLSGTIPEFSLPWGAVDASLQQLIFSNNTFNGSLPRIPFPSSIVLLDFSDNYFSGTIPASYKRSLNDIGTLDLRWNDLEGDLSHVPEVLQVLLIDWNHFSFNISEIALPTLVELSASHNLITGSPTFRKWTALRSMNLKNNALSGHFDWAALEQAFIGGVVASIDIQDNPNLHYGVFPPSLAIAPFVYPWSNSSYVLCHTLRLLNLSTNATFEADPGLFAYEMCKCSDGSYGNPPDCYECPSNAAHCEVNSVFAPAGEYISVYPSSSSDARNPQIPLPLRKAQSGFMSAFDAIDHFIDASFGQAVLDDSPSTLSNATWCGRSICIEPCHIDAWSQRSACNTSDSSSRFVGLVVPQTCSSNPTSPCVDGTTGRLCAKCTCHDIATDCFYHLGNSCFRCPKGAYGKLGLTLALLSSSFVLIVALAAYAWMKTAEEAKSDVGKRKWVSRIVHHLEAKFPSGLLLIMVQFWQTVGIIFPDSMTGIIFARSLSGRLGPLGLACMSQAFHKPIIQQSTHLLLPFIISFLVLLGVCLARLARAIITRLRLRVIVASTTVLRGDDTWRQYLPIPPVQSDYEDSLLPSVDDDDDTRKPSLRLSHSLPPVEGESATDTDSPRFTTSSPMEKEIRHLIRRDDLVYSQTFRHLIVQWPLVILRLLYIGTVYSSLAYFIPDRQACSGIVYVGSHPDLRWSETGYVRVISTPFLIYSVAFPAYLLAVQLIAKSRKRAVPTVMAPVVELYRSATDWWETVTYFRRLLFAVLARFMPSNSALFSGSLVIAHTAFLILQLTLRPWKRKVDNVAESVFLSLLNINVIANTAGYLRFSFASSLYYVVISLDIVATFCFLVYAIRASIPHSRRPTQKAEQPRFTDSFIPADPTEFML